MKKLLQIKWLLVFGLLMRIAFMKWGAPVYYGTESYATNGGDTWAWVSCMQNLVHTGTYTADPAYPDGKFFRPPGYAFFLMIFYLLSGLQLELAFKMAAIAQIVLDTITIFLVYRIVKILSGKEHLALLSGALYCFYPFSLVWTPVLYAESPSLFFMFLTLYLLIRPTAKYNHLLAGIFMGINVLLRVQTIFLVPPIAIYLWQKSGSFQSLFKRPVLGFFIAFGLTYGSWPLRNLCYGRFIPAEEIVNDKHFSEDFVAYMFYIWSVKTDHRPQFDQIIHGEKVDWPAASYLHPGDSITLARLANLCNTCGRGFSHFKLSAGLVKSPITEYNECTREIAETFDRLRKEQMKNNSFHFYVQVPLSNLKKALFKSSLYDQKSKIVIIVSSLLFSFRTFMIALGLLGIWLNRKHKLMDQRFLLLTFWYFSLWYLALCFGYRNIEIRYFLSTDVLLLIPGSIPVFLLLDRIFKFKTVQPSNRTL
ncbi:MAG: glycosyltransferase family 39 protein [Bacteroidia bacterium]|nr:glycosyltransferase family 39 protein [Bacteroidia bacterium]